MIAPLSRGEGHAWVSQAREAVRDWNQAVLAGRPFRVELIVYDEDEGPAVPRRLLVDPEVWGVAAGAGSPLLPALQNTRLAIRLVHPEEDARLAIRSLLEEVAKAP